VEWYYAKDGKQQGPISMAQLRQLASSGRLEPTDMVFKTGTTDWVDASTVAGLFASARSAPAAPAAPEGGFAFGEEKAVVAPTRRKGARARVEKEEDVEEDAPRPRLTRGSRGGGSIGDMLMFRRMVAPWVIMVLFWLGVVGSVLYNLYMIYRSFTSPFGGGVLGAVIALVSIPLSILMLRLYCEILIVVFRMNETLTDIKNVLERQRDG
jgi:hypothetical protein